MYFTWQINKLKLKLNWRAFVNNLIDNDKKVDSSKKHIYRQFKTRLQRSYPIQGRSQKKLMTEAMSMEDIWPRQSVHGWVLFLSIKSVYNDYKQQKWKKLPRQVPRLACY